MYRFNEFPYNYSHFFNKITLFRAVFEEHPLHKCPTEQFSTFYGFLHTATKPHIYLIYLFIAIKLTCAFEQMNEP